MIIRNDYFKLEVKDKKVIYNLNEIKYDSYVELYDILLKFLQRKKISNVLLEGEFEPLNDIEQVVLMVLCNFYKSVYSLKYKKDLDISFSYNFPLCSQKWIIEEVLRIGKKAFDSNMIVLADTCDFIKQNINNENKYHNFYKKYGYYIRRGMRLFDIKNCNLDLAIDYWNDYCAKKHNKRFSHDAVEVYNDIYSNLGFNSIAFKKDNNIVLTGVYYIDEDDKTLYFLITGWNDKYNKYSPGIIYYSFVIDYCYKHNYKVSFCYGLQDYKLKLLKSFGE